MGKMRSVFCRPSPYPAISDYSDRLPYVDSFNSISNVTLVATGQEWNPWMVHIRPMKQHITGVDRIRT